MSLFIQPKPRGFHHEYMYVNMRKNKLSTIESRAKDELGLSEKTVHDHGQLHGAFINATYHVRRRRERRASGGIALSFGMIVVLLLVLLAIWKALL